MFYSRRLNRERNTVEVWACEWSNKGSAMSRKEFLHKVGDEGDVTLEPQSFSVAEAVCWAPGRTIGNIAVSSEEVLGMFVGQHGNDALLPCQIVPCGKFRNGARRWYCKTHQMHWGTKADYAAAGESGEVKCSNHQIKMSYVLEPLELDFVEFEEIGIWCSLPQAISSEEVSPRAPKIHVHKRFKGQSHKEIDDDFDAIVCSYSQNLGLFHNPEITKIQVTPPAAFEFVVSLETGTPMDCVSCKKCGYPHLDLGDFARTPHKKHFCGNCGNDSIWSKTPIASTPLRPLHDQFHCSKTSIEPERALDLDKYKGHPFDVWASTPAVVWTASRPQEVGIHVHVYNADRSALLEDETFGEVRFQGELLDRSALWERMLQSTIC